MSVRAADPAARALAALAVRVTEAPWLLDAGDLRRAHLAGIDDAGVLHAILLASFFGHLNRLADAVGIDLDYQVAIAPIHADPATPPYARPDPALWPDPRAPRSVGLGLRPTAAEALARWRSYVVDRDAPLTHRQRAVLARAVAERLGDAVGAHERAGADPTGVVEEALVALADQVTLAPWRLGAETIAALREAGMQHDVTLFDAVATATACTTFSRLEVALSALARTESV